MKNSKLGPDNSKVAEDSMKGREQDCKLEPNMLAEYCTTPGGHHMPAELSTLAEECCRTPGEHCMLAEEYCMTPGGHCMMAEPSMLELQQNTLAKEPRR